MVVAGLWNSEYNDQIGTELISLNGTDIGKSVPKFPFPLLYPTGRLIGTTPMICGGFIARGYVDDFKAINYTINKVSALAERFQYFALTAMNTNFFSAV